MSDVKTLTINGSSYDITAASVVNGGGGSSLKFWTGTKAQYDALVSAGTIDSGTLYNIVDDSDIAISILDALYPVGSLYIGSGNLAACPLSVLGVGTWTLKSANSIVTDIDGTVPVKGNGLALGLTNGTTNYGLQGGNSSDFYQLCLQTDNYGANVGPNSLSTKQDIHYNAYGVTTDGSKSGIVADLSNVSTTTLTVKIWERIS